jgi:hypothetical protein
VISRTASGIGAVTAVCLAERGIRVVIGTFPVPAVVLDDRRSMASANARDAAPVSSPAGRGVDDESVGHRSHDAGAFAAAVVVDRGLRASHDRFGDQCTAV